MKQITMSILTLCVAVLHRCLSARHLPCCSRWRCFRSPSSPPQLFSTVKDGPYEFRIRVKLADRAGEIQFPISAWSPHRPSR